MQTIIGGNLLPKSIFPLGCKGADLKLPNSWRSKGKAPAINPLTAEVYDTHQLISVHTAAGDTSLELNYRSSLADSSNTVLDVGLGRGWSHSLNIILIQTGADFTLLDGNGEIVTFRWTRNGYKSSTGQSMELAITSSTTVEVILLSGTKYKFGRGNCPYPLEGTVYLLERIVDLNGKVTQFTYTNGLLTRVTDPFGNNIDFEYTLDGKLAHVSDESETDITLGYDADGMLEAVHLPEEIQIKYEYNFRGQMTKKEISGLTTWYVDYNADGKACRLRDGDGNTAYTMTNTSGWSEDIAKGAETREMHYVPGTTSLTDGRGNQWIYTYDDRAFLVEQRLPHYYPGGASETYTYDPNHLGIVSKKDANGNITGYEYDVHGNLIKITDPLGNETIYEYDPILNLITKKIEPDGDEWLYKYDLHGNLTKIIDPIIESPDDAVTIFTYDSNGLCASMTDCNGHTTVFGYDSGGWLSRKRIDPNGLNLVTEYQCDSIGRTVRITNPCGFHTDYKYDLRGRLIREIIDPNGLNLTSSYEYDGMDNLKRRLDPRGIATDYEYNVRGLLKRKTIDPNGLNPVTLYEYDENGNKIRVTNPNGNMTRWEYTGSNRVSKKTDAEGNETDYLYDRVGNLVQTVDAKGMIKEYEYDQLNRPKKQTIDPNSLNLVITYEYEIPGGSGCGECLPPTPGTGKIHKLTDPNGKIAFYYYDKLDRLTKIVRKVNDANDDGGDDDDFIASYQYDPEGNKLFSSIKNSPLPDLQISYEYDAANRIIKRIHAPFGERLSWTYLYNECGNIIVETTSNGNVLTYSYDPANRIVQQSDSLGIIATYGYDENGNILNLTDGLGHSQTYTYDNANRQTAFHDSVIESPGDKFTQYKYDKNSNLVHVIKNNGGTIDYEYDKLNRFCRVVYDPCGMAAEIKYLYDGIGNVTQVINDNNSTTVYEYDGVGRLTHKTYSDGTDTKLEYDPSGNLIAYTDQMGNKTTYSYDDLYRPIRRNYADGGSDSLVYSLGGLLLSTDNAHSHAGFSYDGLGRLISDNQADVPCTYNYTVQYTYSSAPNARTITYPGGKNVVEVLDKRDRITEVWQDGVKTTWYTYQNPGTRLLEKNYANGTHSEYSHNDNNRITELSHISSDDVTFAGFVREYDEQSNPLNAVNQQAVMPYDNTKPITQSEKFTFDALDRLVDYKRGQWIAGDIPSPTRHRSWQIDGASNWRQFTIDDKNYGNSVNQMNQYDDISTNGPSPIPDDNGQPDDFMADTSILKVDLNGDGRIDLPDLAIIALFWLAPDCQAPQWCGGTDLNRDGRVDTDELKEMVEIWLEKAGRNFAHDKNGNLVDDDVLEYFYDYDHRPIHIADKRDLNRLTQVNRKADGQRIAQYWYDPFGRRIRKVADGISTIYVYSDRSRVIEEYEAGSLTRDYTYGRNIDEILTMDDAMEQRYYYHGNIMDSIIAVTDNNGAVVERYSYDAYGEPTFTDLEGNIIGQSLIKNSYLFAGYRYDPETTLYYCRNRYFNPIIGRFITVDPAPTGILNSTLNLGNDYSYVGNNPVKWSDPFGFGPNDPDTVKNTEWEIRDIESTLAKLEQRLEKLESKQHSDIYPPLDVSQLEEGAQSNRELQRKATARIAVVTGTDYTGIYAAMGGNEPLLDQGWGVTFGEAYAPPYEVGAAQSMWRSVEGYTTLKDLLDKYWEECRRYREGHEKDKAEIKKKIEELKKKLEELKKKLEKLKQKEKCRQQRHRPAPKPQAEPKPPPDPEPENPDE